MGSWINRETVTVGDAVCVVLAGIWTGQSPAHEPHDADEGERDEGGGEKVHLAAPEKEIADNVARHEADQQHEDAKLVAHAALSEVGTRRVIAPPRTAGATGESTAGRSRNTGSVAMPNRSKLLVKKTGCRFMLRPSAYVRAAQGSR
jgi:hypothetical protein